MTFIKRVVMHGFKSFARKTEIIMENSMNVIVGPNGSGKSNITDALCFVLGRLSIKSIRAAKAANLLFSGNKLYKGAQEAFVELVFDNSDKTFSLDGDEVSIKRVVRKNGISVYKINNKTKTRQELLELLAQGGVDPNGFNIVLQGEIASLIKSSSEDRRKIIEEVAGISIYESRKIKSVRELEKVEEKIKEVGAVLKARNSYLKNLEKERQDALNFKKLEETIVRCKKTLIDSSINIKDKEIWGIDKLIENFSREIDKLKNTISDKNIGIEDLQVKITDINKKIQDVTSNEQDVLHRDISDLKAELAGLDVRRENYENRLDESTERIDDIGEKVGILETEIKNIQTKSPEIKKQQEKQKILSDRFDLLEKQRRRFYVVKSELSSLDSERNSKHKFLIESKKELEMIEKNVDSLFSEIKYAKSVSEAESVRVKSKQELERTKSELVELENRLLAIEKRNAVLEDEISREKKLRDDIVGLDKCTVCKQVVGEGHKKEISSDSNSKIKEAASKVEKNIDLHLKAKNKIDDLKRKQSDISVKINEIEIDIIKLNNAEEKKGQIKRIVTERESVKGEIKDLDTRILKYKKEFDSLKNVESDYDDVRLELQELSFADIDVDSEVIVKQREISRLVNEKKSLARDMEESEVELKKNLVLLGEKNKVLQKKLNEERKLFDKCEVFFSDRNGLQDKQKVLETDILGLRFKMREFEDKLNENKITKAQINAQIDSLKRELVEFGDASLIKGSVVEIKEKLQNAQFRISRLGNVNMRALEVFDQVKEQVESIKLKVETIEGEKLKIESIIAEIDKKKKKVFLHTLSNVNEFFTRNFKLLSRKGEVTLELENKKNPFDGGLNIIVRVSKGKFFDITSLSGGEKTLVALSLIFAIQEYKPYCFYIFDEIDAALDKRNSELLSALIQKYMKAGQYIIITHNDTLISDATTLYGVSMQENISKVVSLKV